MGNTYMHRETRATTGEAEETQGQEKGKSNTGNMRESRGNERRNTLRTQRDLWDKAEI